VKNAGWPPSDGMPGTCDWPPAPWQARHCPTRSSKDAPDAGEPGAKNKRAAKAAAQVEGGDPALDPDRRLTAGS